MKYNILPLFLTTALALDTEKPKAGIYRTTTSECQVLHLYDTGTHRLNIACIDRSKTPPMRSASSDGMLVSYGPITPQDRTADITRARTDPDQLTLILPSKATRRTLKRYAQFDPRQIAQNDPKAKNASRRHLQIMLTTIQPGNYQRLP